MGIDADRALPLKTFRGLPSDNFLTWLSNVTRQVDYAEYCDILGIPLSDPSFDWRPAETSTAITFSEWTVANHQMQTMIMDALGPAPRQRIAKASTAWDTLTMLNLFYGSRDKGYGGREEMSMYVSPCHDLARQYDYPETGHFNGKAIVSTTTSCHIISNRECFVKRTGPGIPVGFSKAEFQGVAKVVVGGHELVLKDVLFRDQTWSMLSVARLMQEIGGLSITWSADECKLEAIDPASGLRRDFGAHKCNGMSCVDIAPAQGIEQEEV